MDIHTLIRLYDAYLDATSELEEACKHFEQAVIDLHSFDISLAGTETELLLQISKLEHCHKSIVEFQDKKDKGSELG